MYISRCTNKNEQTQLVFQGMYTTFKYEKGSDRRFIKLKIYARNKMWDIQLEPFLCVSIILNKITDFNLYKYRIAHTVL